MIHYFCQNSSFVGIPSQTPLEILLCFHTAIRPAGEERQHTIKKNSPGLWKRWTPSHRPQRLAHLGHNFFRYCHDGDKLVDLGPKITYLSILVVVAQTTQLLLAFFKQLHPSFLEGDEFGRVSSFWFFVYRINTYTCIFLFNPGSINANDYKTTPCTSDKGNPRYICLLLGQTREWWSGVERDSCKG